jgi:hypothetical protein
MMQSICDHGRVVLLLNVHMLCYVSLSFIIDVVYHSCSSPRVLFVFGGGSRLLFSRGTALDSRSLGMGRLSSRNIHGLACPA